MANRVAPQDQADDETALSDYSELRSLLLGPEQARLQQLLDQQKQFSEQINDELARLKKLSQLNSERLAEHLPASITASSQSGDDFNNALAPTLPSAIKTAASKDMKGLVEAIFPILGPAIRKSVSAAFQDFVQSFNEIIEQSLSIKGLKWRLESIRTGQSFADVALKHSLIYGVEQVFLIHRESGLLLAHEVSSTAMARDPDLVSGMLSAIQSFVEDSFMVKSGDGLDTLRMAELNLLIDQAPLTVMALVVRGNSPAWLRRLLTETNEQIHARYLTELQSFDGDVSHFETSHELLKRCVKSKFHKGKSAEEKKLPVLAIFIISLPLLFVLLWIYTLFTDIQKWNQVVEDIASQAGIVVVEDDGYGESRFIRGLRDPIADSPALILSQAGYDASGIALQFEPYHSLDSELVLRRAEAILQPPSSVKLFINENKVLSLGGIAHNEWLLRARSISAQIKDIHGYDDDKVINIEQQQLHAAISEWQNLVLSYERGVSTINEVQRRKVAEIVLEIKKLVSMSNQVGRKLSFYVEGFTDNETGTAEFNKSLRRERAQYIYDILIEMGVNPNRLNIAKDTSVNNTLSPESERHVVVSLSLLATD